MWTLLLLSTASAQDCDAAVATWLAEPQFVEIIEDTETKVQQAAVEEFKKRGPKVERYQSLAEAFWPPKLEARRDKSLELLTVAYGAWLKRYLGCDYLVANGPDEMGTRAFNAAYGEDFASMSTTLDKLPETKVWQDATNQLLLEHAPDFYRKAVDAGINVAALPGGKRGLPTCYEYASSIAKGDGFEATMKAVLTSTLHHRVEERLKGKGYKGKHLEPAVAHLDPQLWPLVLERQEALNEPYQNAIGAALGCDSSRDAFVPPPTSVWSTRMPRNLDGFETHPAMVDLLEAVDATVDAQQASIDAYLVELGLLKRK